MSMTQSIPFKLSRAAFEALRDAPEFVGARVLDNPTDRSALADGNRVIFVEDVRDEPNSQEGQAEARAFTLIVGTIARTEDARTQADADTVQAKRTITAGLVLACRALRTAGEILFMKAPSAVTRRAPRSPRESATVATCPASIRARAAAT